MKKYLPLLIASTLLVGACKMEHTKKEKKPAEKAVTQEVMAETEVKAASADQVAKPAPVVVEHHAPHTVAPAQPHTTHQPEASSQPQPQQQAQQPQPALVKPAPQAVAPQQPTISQQAVLNAGLCHATTDGEIARLFDRWNASLKTGRSDAVVANYAPDSILLPTVSNKVRHSAAEKADYFDHFLENSPVGEINERYIKIGCNTALDAGVYTFHFSKTGTSVTGRYSFTYEWNGHKWLITSHHSSVMPEQAAKEQAKARENIHNESTH